MGLLGLQKAALSFPNMNVGNMYFNQENEIWKTLEFRFTRK
jgi:hypothetical protein